MTQYRLTIEPDYEVSFESYQDALNTLLNKFSSDSELSHYLKEQLKMEASVLSLVVLNTKLQKYNANLEVGSSSSTIVLSDFEEISDDGNVNFNYEIDPSEDFESSNIQKALQGMMNYIKNISDVVELYRSQGKPIEFDKSQFMSIYQSVDNVEMTEGNSEELTSLKVALKKIIQ